MPTQADGTGVVRPTAPGGGWGCSWQRVPLNQPVVASANQAPATLNVGEGPAAAGDAATVTASVGADVGGGALGEAVAATLGVALPGISGGREEVDPEREGGGTALGGAAVEVRLGPSAGVLLTGATLTAGAAGTWLQPASSSKAAKPRR